ncbi:NAD(P)/FAD-dependent oxidoreductase [Thermaurantiacus sp.]
MTREVFDFVVIGGGIFGCYSALYLSRRGFSVLLIEREKTIWQKASVVNQARLHFGYHYPRSFATAVMANSHRLRFIAEHQAFINSSFTNYYAIDAANSLTDARQFSRFCARLGIPARLVSRDDLIVSERVEALYATTEYSFDPYMIREHYRSMLRDESVRLLVGTEIVCAEDVGHRWRIELRRGEAETFDVDARAVINATYANLNSINALFQVPCLEVTHELSEILLVKSDALAGIGLTVMDGPYLSIMPYGLSGLHSLSSVLYTHHAVSTRDDPTFACQATRVDCVPKAVRVCTTCPSKPRSNKQKMISQLGLYIKPEHPIYSYGSLFTIKTKLKSSHIDDARPTEIGMLRDNPRFYCLFSGKINSIYEVERVMESA